MNYTVYNSLGLNVILSKQTEVVCCEATAPSFLWNSQFTGISELSDGYQHWHLQADTDHNLSPTQPVALSQLFSV